MTAEACHQPGIVWVRWARVSPPSRWESRCARALSTTRHFRARVGVCGCRGHTVDINNSSAVLLHSSHERRTVRGLTRWAATVRALQDEKLARREAWEAQLKKLSDRLHTVANSDVELFAAWIDKVAQIRENLATETAVRSRQTEARLKDIQAVDQTLLEQFAVHTAKRKAVFVRLHESLVEPEQHILSTVSLRARAVRRRQRVAACGVMRWMGCYPYPPRSSAPPSHVPQRWY